MLLLCFLRWPVRSERVVSVWNVIYVKVMSFDSGGPCDPTSSKVGQRPTVTRQLYSKYISTSVKLGATNV